MRRQRSGWVDDVGSARRALIHSGFVWGGFDGMGADGYGLGIPCLAKHVVRKAIKNMPHLTERLGGHAVMDDSGARRSHDGNLSYNPSGSSRKHASDPTKRQPEQPEETNHDRTIPPPPPPPPENREAVADAPKKVWSKPCILRIEYGTLETQTASDTHPDPENCCYSPMS